MIHEIAPHHLHMEYKKEAVKNQDIILWFQDQQVALVNRDGVLQLPTGEDYNSRIPNWKEDCEYIFALDEKGVCFYQPKNQESKELFEWENITVFRNFSSKHEAFAGITASQLYRWKRDNVYCGRCQTPLEESKVERALHCPKCGSIIYPKISPAIIVAITDGSRLLLTKYAHGNYKNYSLVAGYVEVGESFEETVKREVMEEVGLKVKNIRYYKSTPWSFSDTIMVGFFAELDGDDKITLQESELSEATWFRYDELPKNSNKISIAQELIDKIRKSKRNL